jgi:tektin-2
MVTGGSFCRAMHNILVGHLNLIEQQLVNKIHALNVEQKCLKYRERLEDPDRS